ncbi:MAG: hypothetical protein AAFV98_03045 [Chloroflexota bacterium]
MKIQGYDVGTEVKWTDEESTGFCTGIVRARFYDPSITEINGQEIEINVIGNSPEYAVEQSNDADIIVINHTKVVRSQATDDR